MSREIVEAMHALAREKGIAEDKLLHALEDALLSAYKKQPGAAKYARVEQDPEIDPAKFEEYRDQIDEADVTPEDFGRIAAQTAKQVILQRIREAERDMMFEEYR